MAIDGIQCEAALTGHIVFLKNEDVPGVIGYIGSITGKNNINIANFALGRQDVAAPGKPLQAVAIIETDSAVTEPVLTQFLENKAVTVARSVELTA